MVIILNIGGCIKMGIFGALELFGGDLYRVGVYSIPEGYIMNFSIIDMEIQHGISDWFQMTLYMWSILRSRPILCVI